MEPDVLRLYSSSPPPLDDGGAEDEDDEFGEFGEFGGFGHGPGAMAASFSFSDMDTTPPAVASHQSHACDTAPPELPIGPASAAPGSQKSSLVGRAPGSSTSASDPSQQIDDLAQAEHEGGPTISTKSEACGSTGTTVTLSSAHNNGGVGVLASLVNGFPETPSHAQDASVDSLSPPTTSALSSPSSSSYNSPCVQRRSEEDAETETETEYYDATSQHNNINSSSNINVTSGPPGFNGLSNGSTVLHSHTKETRRDGDRHGDGDGDEVSSAEEQEVLSLDEDSETRDQETPVQHPQSLSDSTLHTEASVTTQGGIERPVTLFNSSSTSQEGTVSDHHQGSRCDEDIRPAENEDDEVVEKEEEEEEDHADLPTPSGPTQTSESDDFASFCDVVSPSDDFGDFGHFGSTEAPPFSCSSAVTATSEGPSIVPPDDHGDGDDEDEDDDFGGFGEAEALSAQGFADFSQTKCCTREEKEEEEQEEADGGGCTRFPVQFPPSSSSSSSTAPCNAASESSAGDQSLPGGGASSLESGEVEAEGEGVGGSCPEMEVVEEQEQQLSQLPVSDSFADFQSVPVGGEVDDGEDWAAFGEPEGVAGEVLGGQASGGGGGAENWAAFGDEQQTQVGKEEDEEGEDAQWQDVATATPPIYASPHTSRRESLTVPLSCRLQRLFQASFAPVEAPQVGQQAEEEIPSLQVLLETQQQQQQPAEPGAPPDPNPADQQNHQPPTAAAHREPGDMWRHLQDIHGALGLKFLWGGSHSNRQLLRCLAVDTRNIVFAGQKKQPVIVPAFATGLGMLEPTKDAVNPTSAAVPVAASAQVPPGSPSRPSKEAVSSAQPDWSSSGLKPPADGVDPELYELTTGPLEPSSTGKNIADAFTRLMSTMEQNSTSTRRPAKEESVSEEATRVLSVLPDLSFMRAKVLMFPSILTPLQPPDAAS
ncbi:aftiphilin [Engraulis encrasicolus]|uniref:aftiphilin n=1 Tax=Engraulis encrasicolus TaxID=184585 RepID=UPI002FCE6FE9